MRVCFLTHYFPPEVGAPQTRIELLALTLAADGAEVTVHTGFPHYPDGGVKAPYRNRPWLTERRDGIRIVRSAVYPAANRGFAPRLADHTAFALSALATSRAAGLLDVVVGESPPLFTAAAGAIYARSKRAAYVVNVADRWPASAVELGALRNARAIAAAEGLERWVYRQADLVLSPTEGIATTLAGVPDAAGKSHRVWPVVDLDRFDGATPRARDDGAPLRVLFAGTVGLAHGLDVLVDASRLAGPEVVRTQIAGDGADGDRIRRLIDEQGVTNVEMLGVLPLRPDPGAVSRERRERRAAPRSPDLRRGPADEDARGDGRRPSGAPLGARRGGPLRGGLGCGPGRGTRRPGRAGHRDPAAAQRAGSAALAGHGRARLR